MKNGPVLLVDDEPVVLNLNAAAVRHFGFEALTADTVEDGLEIVRAYKPALIISDVQMPGMGGFDFAESMERQGMKMMPIIYMTGYNDLEIFRGGLRVGGDDFVAKGSPIEVLRRRVAFWMTTGFPALPKELRRRALNTVNNMDGDDVTDIQHHLSINPELIDRVGGYLMNEMKPLGSEYGYRMVDRICYLGRLSRLILDESNTFGDYLRFPDYIREITNQLKTPWASDMWPLLKQFENYVSDPRFVYAGNDGLRHFRDYAWFSEGHELFE
jgi:CheY-like chemotaxis protein